MKRERVFLLHHTHEGRIGLCASDDPNPPSEERVIERLTLEQTFALSDDIDETLLDCVHRDGNLTPEHDDIWSI